MKKSILFKPPSLFIYLFIFPQVASLTNEYKDPTQSERALVEVGWGSKHIQGMNTRGQRAEGRNHGSHPRIYPLQAITPNSLFWGRRDTVDFIHQFWNLLCFLEHGGFHFSTLLKPINVSKIVQFHFQDLMVQFSHFPCWYKPQDFLLQW